MQEFIRFFILGLATGGIYTLLALGVIVVFRATGAVNFANGAVAVSSGYFLLYLESLKWPIVPAVAGGIAAGMVLGIAVQVLVMRPLRRSSALTKAIATLGVLVILQAACQLKFGSDPQIVPAYLPQTGFSVLGAHLTADVAIVFGVGLVLTALLFQGYRKTRFGLATSAVSESEESLESLGWSASLVATGNWALAGLLAGIAGVLLAPIVGLSLAEMTSLLMPALAAALFGRLASFPLALIGSLFIGVIQSELTWYGQEPVIRLFPNLSDAVPFLVIIGVLMWRAKSLPARDFVGARLPRLGSGRLSLPLVAVLVAVAAVLIQVVLPVDWVVATTSCLVAGVLLLSLVQLIGYAGQLSLAQLSIGGLGALIAARLVVDAGFPLPVAAVIGVAAAIPVGVVVGLPAVRTRGVTLAVVTLGLAAALNALVYSTTSVTNGSAGLDVGTARIFGVAVDEATHPRRYALLALALFALVALAVRNIRVSPIGRRFIAVRSNERAAASLGISVVRTKLYAFVLSSAIATIAGLLAAFRYSTAVFTSFDPFQSVNYVVEAVIGGVGFVAGAATGTAIEPSGLGSKVIDDVGFGRWLILIGGILLVITLILNSDGIAGNTSAQIDWVRNRLTERSGRRRPYPSDPPSLEALSQSEPTTLRVDDLSVAFGGVKAVDHVSFELRSGEILGVIGPNGAGKTTLVDAVTGYVASRGSATIGGVPIQSMPAHKRARLGIARSFQSLELFEDLTVAENLLAAAEPSRWLQWVACLVWPGRRRLDAATVAVISEFELTETLGMAPADLSYGQRRLLAISRAVSSRPRVLLLDEPAAGLGERDRADLRGLLRKLSSEWGIAVLLIEHDVDLVMSVSDRVIALEFGREIASGSPSEVRRHPDVIRAYLGASEDEDVDAADAVVPALTTAEPVSE